MQRISGLSRMSELQCTVKCSIFTDALEFRHKKVEDEKQIDIDSEDKDFLPHILYSPDSRPCSHPSLVQSSNMMWR